MTPGKRLIYSNSAVSADIGSPSRRHPTIILWLHEGIAKATRRRVGFLDHRAASCILRVAFLDHRAASCIRRVAFGRRTIPNGTDDHTKLTRFDKMHSRCTPDGLTKGKMDTRTQHDIEPSGVASGILWHVKDFVTAPEVAAEA